MVALECEFKGVSSKIWRKTKIFTTSWSHLIRESFQMSRSQLTMPRYQHWKQSFLKKIQRWFVSSQKKLTRWRRTCLLSPRFPRFPEATAICSEKQLAEYRDANKAMFLSSQGTPDTWEMHDSQEQKCAQLRDEGVIHLSYSLEEQASMSRSMPVRVVKYWLSWSSFLRRWTATLRLQKLQHGSTRRRLMNWVTQRMKRLPRVTSNTRSLEEQEMKLSNECNTTEVKKRVLWTMETQAETLLV